MDPSRPPIEELLRRLGRAAIFREAEAHGLSPRGNRIRCPFKGCQDAGPGRERDAQVYEGGHPRVWCFRCGTRGDYLDLLQATRGWTAAQAVAHVQGLEVPTGPVLAVVPPPPPPDEGKLPPAEVQRLWDALALDDPDGRAYLEGRHLDGAIEAGLVRFATPDAKASQVAYLGRRGYRAAALVSDVTGAPRGIQVRLCRDAMAKEVKVMSVKGSATGRAFFGQPGLIEASPVVVVAEGLADTLAASLWVGEAAVVVGAAGKGALPRLADELEAAGIGLEGKVFALLPQNDRPTNASRREFARLAQRLGQLKATVAWVATPDEFKDLAEWRAARGEAAWPPPEVARAFGPDAGGDAAASVVVPEGSAVAIPVRVTAETYTQSFTTLNAILDDPASREAVMGKGELCLCEMTGGVRLGGRLLGDTDLSAVRLGLETQGRSTDGKPLRFDESEVAKALALLASRRKVHPVRAWLCALPVWDGKPRVGELAQALGLEADSFEAILLRRWLVGAVSRAMTPGRKMDTVLVLVGRQGVGKSTLFAELAGPWHTDSRVDVADKDGKLVMRRAWVVEWAELDSMRRARDQEAVKAFLSSRVDLFRPPFGRSVIEAPRHCVIVGTTNNAEFLHDATGSRRFWPVEVERVDVAAVRAMRDQLWAEALAAFRQGDPWWLDQDQEAELARRAQRHEAKDAWEDLIEDWLEAQHHVSEVTVGQLLAGALDRKPKDWTRADEMRIAGVMASLGWRQDRPMEHGRRRRVYVRPPRGGGR